MMHDNEKRKTNVVVAGLGGQGVVLATDILADTAFRAGYDVKKSEIHGMSQRGGSVTSDVRFGDRILSPMVPIGEADFLVVMVATQVENNRHLLKEGGVLITCDLIDQEKLSNRKCLNVALLGVLSTYLDVSTSTWTDAIRANLPEKVHTANSDAFEYGRSLGTHRP